MYLSKEARMPKRSIAVLVLLETDDPRLDPDHIDVRAYCFPAQAAVYSSGRAVLITPIRP